MYKNLCGLFTFISLLFVYSTASAITFHTLDVPSAVNHGAGFDGFGYGAIRGNGTDFDQVAGGVDPAVRNSVGALSYGYTTFAPSFALIDAANQNDGDYMQTYSGTSTWDSFSVSTSTVTVGAFDVNVAVTQTDRPNLSTNFPSVFGVPVGPEYDLGALYTLTRDHSAGHAVSFDVEAQTVSVAYTQLYEYNGLHGPWVGTVTEFDYTGVGGFIVNSPGKDTATASQFGGVPSQFGAPVDPNGPAAYLNFIRDNYLPTDWTSAGILLTGGQHNATNTRGFFGTPSASAPLPINGEAFPGTDSGGWFQGTTVWFTTDAFLFGTPLDDADGDGVFSAAEVADLISSGDFPSLGGLRLAGDEFAQLYDVEVIGSEGDPQTIVFDYDDSIIDPLEEPLLKIAHYVDGAWEFPDQTLDTAANTITVIVDSFSPFALVAVPVPGAVYLMISGLAVLLLPRRPRVAGY